MFSRERAVKTHFKHAALFAAGQQLVDHLFTGADSRSHQHNHALGLRMAVVFERLVLASGCGGKVIHCLLDVVINRVVPRVCGLA